MNTKSYFQAFLMATASVLLVSRITFCANTTTVTGNDPESYLPPDLKSIQQNNKNLQNNGPLSETAILENSAGMHGDVVQPNAPATPPPASILSCVAFGCPNRTACDATSGQCKACPIDNPACGTIAPASCNPDICNPSNCVRGIPEILPCNQGTCDCSGGGPTGTQTDGTETCTFDQCGGACSPFGGCMKTTTNNVCGACSGTYTHSCDCPVIPVKTSTTTTGPAQPNQPSLPTVTDAQNLLTPAEKKLLSTDLSLIPQTLLSEFTSVVILPATQGSPVYTFQSGQLTYYLQPLAVREPQGNLDNAEFGTPLAFAVQTAAWNALSPAAQQAFNQMNFQIGQEQSYPGETVGSGEATFTELYDQRNWYTLFPPTSKVLSSLSPAAPNTYLQMELFIAAASAQPGGITESLGIQLPPAVDYPGATGLDVEQKQLSLVGNTLTVGDYTLTLTGGTTIVSISMGGNVILPDLNVAIDPTTLSMLQHLP